MDGRVVSRFDLSRTLPVGGDLLVPYSLSGSPVIKQLIQMVTMEPGQGRRFQSTNVQSLYPYKALSSHYNTLLRLSLWKMENNDEEQPRLFLNCGSCV